MLTGQPWHFLNIFNNYQMHRVDCDQSWQSLNTWIIDIRTDMTNHKQNLSNDFGKLKFGKDLDLLRGGVGGGGQPDLGI